jgi:hypothetical protein
LNFIRHIQVFHYSVHVNEQLDIYDKLTVVVGSAASNDNIDNSCEETIGEADSNITSGDTAESAVEDSMNYVCMEAVYTVANLCANSSIILSVITSVVASFSHMAQNFVQFVKTVAVNALLRSA